MPSCDEQQQKKKKKMAKNSNNDKKETRFRLSVSVCHLLNMYMAYD